jgi:mRNA interferase HigB
MIFAVPPRNPRCSIAIGFDVAGGNYRLIAAFDFRRQIVFVKFNGTHAAYDAIDALTVARF